MEAELIHGVTPSYNTRHQKWLSNIQTQVKYTPQLIANCLQENVTRNNQLVTQHDYLIKTANPVIDEEKGVSVEYIQLIKKPQNSDQFGSNPLTVR